MANLYTIASDIRNAVGEVNDDGELDADVAERLDALEMELGTKADAVACYRQQALTDAAGYAEEAARLMRLAKSETNKAERLKAYLHHCLTAAGLDRLDTQRFKLTLAKSPPSVKLFDDAIIPPQYARIETTLNKQAVIRDWKDGKALPGCLAVEQGRHLLVR